MNLTNSNEVLTWIEKIAATSGKSEKQALVGLAKDSGFAKSILRSALDPSITYGLAKNCPAPNKSGKAVFDDATFDILGSLANRTLTGGAAIDTVTKEMERLSPDSGELLRRIILKDMRAGFTEGTCNRAMPGLIPVFEVMLAQKEENLNLLKFPLYVEPKFDGVRCIAVVRGDTVTYLSRSGKVFETMGHMTKSLLALRDASGLEEIAFDGEAMSSTFLSTIGDARRKGTTSKELILHVFEMLPLSVFDGVEYEVSASERRQNLSDTFAAAQASVEKHPSTGEPIVRMTSCYIASNVEEVLNYYTTFRAAGLEGLIIKDMGGTYEQKRSRAWLKMKPYETVDVQVIGMEEGTGKYVGMLGALVVDFEGVKVNVSGMSDELRREMWGDPNGTIGRLVEVGFHEKTPDGSLRHPRFVRYRDDKPLRDGVGV